MKNILKITCLIVLLLSSPVKINACWWINMFDWCGEPGDEFLTANDPESLSALVSEYEPGDVSQDQNYIITTVPFQEVSDAAQLNDFNSNTTIQYFDGLGRISQTVQRAVNPEWNDMVTGVVYDGFGRKSGEWLPAVAPQGNEGAYVPQYQDLANKQAAYGEGNPFTLTKYEPSPLNRVLEQYGPGKDWQTHAKSQKTVFITNGQNAQYGVNIKYFYTEGNVLKCNGYYASGTLYGVGSIDEDDKEAIEFTDKLGRKILTRAGGSYDTYYVYDGFGNLCYVLPPLAADALTGNTTGFSEAKGSPLYLYAYIYRYDERNRNVVKKLPGCDSICMVYDKADRLIASQDGNQRAKHQWTVNKYDALGRLLYTGIYAGNETRTQLANLYSNIVTNESYTGTGDTGGYSCTNLAPSMMLTVNYYDNYDFLDWIPSIIFTRVSSDPSIKPSTGTIRPKDVLTDVEMNDYTPVDKNHTKMLLTGSQAYHLNDFNSELTVFYYDKYGHVVQTRSINHLNGLDLVYNDVDFLGKPLKTYRTHSIYGTSTSVTELYTYTYDKGQRLLNTTLSINGGMNLLLSANNYDELGRLYSKTIGNARTTINYSYNIRNWVTGIADTYFTEILNYNVKPGNLSIFTPCYNGDIAFMQWSIPSENLGYNRAYRFDYDELNRLNTCNYYGVNNGSLVSSVSNKYFEFTTYDKMGNINRLYRYENGTFLNNLSFTYAGNQLKTVNDAVNVTKSYGSEAFIDRAKLATEYAYDENGNMTWDANSGISTIQYNSLNLPDVIQFTEGHQNRYAYDASGQKLNATNYTLHNIVNVPQGTINPLPNNAGDYTKITTDYVGDMIYENGALKEILTPEGYWQNGVYYYYLKDHLGNTRVVVNGSGAIVEKSHYYPSGMRFQESTSNSAALPYRYGGKELEAMNGLNQYDFGARRRFACIPVTTTMDPLCEKYYPTSTYAWCLNNSVNLIDPDGMSTHLNKLGQIVKEYDDDDDGVYTHDDLSDWDNKSTLAKDGIGIHNIGTLNKSGGEIDINDIYTNLLKVDISIAKSMWDPFRFYNLVKPGGDWDYKINANFIYGKLGNNSNLKLLFQGQIMTPEDLGNHHFGVVGKAYGLFSEEFMLKEAGAIQIRDGNSRSEWQIYQEVTMPSPLTGVPITTRTMLPPYGDDPIDQMWIKAGFTYYLNQGK